MSTEFWSKFVEICEATGKTPTGVVRAVGLSSGNPSAWKAGRVPNMGIINKLSEYFGVDPAYFIGLEEKKDGQPAEKDGLTEEETGLLEAFRLLPDSERALILRQLSALSRGK